MSPKNRAAKTSPDELFDWWQVQPVARTRRARSSRPNPYMTELRERAGLLFRLRYSRAAAKARLRANVAWDFELHTTPGFAGQIDGIVDEVYGRSSKGGNAP
jgi:hypothetical protein